MSYDIINIFLNNWVYFTAIESMTLQWDLNLVIFVFVCVCVCVRK